MKAFHRTAHPLSVFPCCPLASFRAASSLHSPPVKRHFSSLSLPRLLLPCLYSRRRIHIPHAFACVRGWVHNWVLISDGWQFYYWTSSGARRASHLIGYKVDWINYPSGRAYIRQIEIVRYNRLSRVQHAVYYIRTRVLCGETKERERSAES